MSSIFGGISLSVGIGLVRIGKVRQGGVSKECSRSAEGCILLRFNLLHLFALALIDRTLKACR